MKIKTAVLAILILLPSGVQVLAKQNPERPFFFLPTAVTMDAAEIPEGMYQLTLSSTKSSVRIELWKDGKFVATARGTWVKSGVKFRDNTILVRVNPDGSRSLIELRFAGVAKTIVLRTTGDSIIQYSKK